MQSLSSAYINFMATSTEDKIIRVSIGGREVRAIVRKVTRSMLVQ